MFSACFTIAAVFQETQKIVPHCMMVANQAIASRQREGRSDMVKFAFFWYRDDNFPGQTGSLGVKKIQGMAGGRRDADADGAPRTVF